MNHGYNFGYVASNAFGVRSGPDRHLGEKRQVEERPNLQRPSG